MENNSIFCHKRQYLAALCATFTAMISGTVTAWTSPSLPSLIQQGTINSNDASWIASIYMLSSVLSVLPAASMVERFGRKLTIIFGCFPFIIGWILIIFNNNSVELYVSRIFSGFGHGIVYTVCPMYLGEIASDKIRGALATMISLMNKTGILLMYSIGAYVSVKLAAMICLSIPFVFLCTFPFQPESPYYYVKRNNMESAEKSLQILLNKKDVKEHLSKIEICIIEQSEFKIKWIDLIKDETNRRSLTVLLVLYTTQQFCGSSAVITYAQQIFTHASGVLGAEESSIIIGVIQLIVCLLSVVTVDRWGRKPLLIFSTIGVAVANLILSAYFYIQYVNSELIKNIGWLPIVTVAMFIISYTMGLSTVPFAITSEVFPVNVKSHAASVVQMFAGLATFAVVKLYQVISENYGQHVIFLCFAIVSILGLIFVILKVPETKGTSLSEAYRRMSV